MNLLFAILMSFIRFISGFQFRHMVTSHAHRIGIRLVCDAIDPLSKYLSPVITVSTACSYSDSVVPLLNI